MMAVYACTFAGLSRPICSRSAIVSTADAGTIIQLRRDSHASASPIAPVTATDTVDHSYSADVRRGSSSLAASSPAPAAGATSPYSAPVTRAAFDHRGRFRTATAAE